MIRGRSPGRHRDGDLPGVRHGPAAAGERHWHHRINDDHKVMAHFPLVLLREPPRSALDICFGMGTTYRSLLRWDGLQVTAVELVPASKRPSGTITPTPRTSSRTAGPGGD